MQIEIVKDEKELAIKVKQLILESIKENQRFNFAITGGRSPVGVYEELYPEFVNNKKFDNVHFYNFDEIGYKNSDKEGITITSLRKLFLDKAKINESNIHLLSDKNYLQWDKIIENDGGLDLMLLGVGADGHYCGNLPNTTKTDDLTTKVIVDEVMNKRISRYFSDSKDIPDYYVTMGPASVLRAKKIIMIALGKEKADIIKKLVEIEKSNNLPVINLKKHNNFMLVVDKEASKLLK